MIMTGLGAASLQSAYADTAGGDAGTINFTGKVLASTCHLDSTSLQVPMGTISADAYKTAGTVGNSVPVPIVLKGCDPSLQDVSVELDGNKDTVNNQLLQLTQDADAAKGFGIELLDPNSTPVPIGDTSNPITLQAGDNTLAFKARYVSTVDSKDLEPGQANAQASFLLKYR